MINDVARDVRLNLLRVDMRAVFDAVFLCTLFACHLISTILRDMLIFVTVKALNDYAVSNKSLAFFDFVVDN
jgi:hypothetical protein